MEHGELTERIIGCAYRVYNAMGFGFVGSIYEKCLLLELRKAGPNAVPQAPILVRYDGVNSGVNRDTSRLFDVVLPAAL